MPKCTSSRCCHRSSIGSQTLARTQVSSASQRAASMAQQRSLTPCSPAEDEPVDELTGVRAPSSAAFLKSSCTVSSMTSGAGSGAQLRRYWNDAVSRQGLAAQTIWRHAHRSPPRHPRSSSIDSHGSESSFGLRSAGKVRLRAHFLLLEYIVAAQLVMAATVPPHCPHPHLPACALLL